MRTNFFTAFAVVWLWTASSPLFAQVREQETNNPAAVSALNDLVGRINEKITQQKTNETDLALLIKEFDSLLQQFKDAPERDRAQILTMKAQLYLLVLNQPEKALEVFQQFKREVPGMQIGGNTEEAIRALEKKITSQRVQRTLVPGSIFPAFDETDLAGKPLSLEQYRGKVVLVDFWATWCVPCLIELPHVIKTYEQFHSRGFEIIGISLDVDRQRLESFIKDKSLPWPQYCDGKHWETKLALKYGIDSVPTSYLLDRKGKIVGVNLRGEELEKAVALATMSGFQRWVTSVGNGTEDMVRKAPYSSLAVVFVAGALAGVLVTVWRFRKSLKPRT